MLPALRGYSEHPWEERVLRFGSSWGRSLGWAGSQDPDITNLAAAEP